MRGLRRLIRLLNHTETMKIFMGYVAVLLVGGLILVFIEPGVKDWFDGVYFCFVASSTIGFGDIVPVTILGKIITVLVTLLGILTAAMVPGVVVAYYTEYLKIREKETISTFLEKLEKLPEMSKEELEELSDRVKEFNKSKKNKF